MMSRVWSGGGDVSTHAPLQTLPPPGCLRPLPAASKPSLKPATLISTALPAPTTTITAHTDLHIDAVRQLAVTLLHPAQVILELPGRQSAEGLQQMTGGRCRGSSGQGGAGKGSCRNVKKQRGASSSASRSNHAASFAKAGQATMATIARLVYICSPRSAVLR